MTRTAKVAAQLGALALVLGLLGLLVWKIVADKDPVARVGQPVPSFDLPNLDDSERVITGGQYKLRTNSPISVSTAPPAKDDGES